MSKYWSICDGLLLLLVSVHVSRGDTRVYFAVIEGVSADNTRANTHDTVEIIKCSVKYTADYIIYAGEDMR